MTFSSALILGHQLQSYSIKYSFALTLYETDIKNVCNKHISRHFTPMKTFYSNLTVNIVTSYCVRFHCSLNSSVSGPVVLFAGRVPQTSAALYKT